MNLSHWENLSDDDRQTLKAKIVKQTRSREMPPLQYRIIHWDAKITDADVATLIAWARQPAAEETPMAAAAPVTAPAATPTATRAPAGRSASTARAAVPAAAARAATEHLTPVQAAAAQVAAPSGAAAPPQETANAERGKAIFQKRCTGCHALEQNREGPRLAGVYGRASGTVPQFAYSDALKNAHITWSDKSLEQWLTDPDLFVPGNDMGFRVARPEERRDVIEFLKQSSAK